MRSVGLRRIGHIRLGLWAMFAVAVLCMVPSAAMAVGVGGTFTSGGLTYKVLTDTTVQVGDGNSGQSVAGDITIPATVTSDGTTYWVTSIGYHAFGYCFRLTSVTIPGSVTSIGDGAFCYSDSLTSVTIPNAVTSLGDWAFSGCTGFTSVTISNAVTSIGDYAFSRCTGLTSVTIPSAVTSIGYQAFSYCAGLTSVTIPSAVTSIGDYALSGCTSLTSIDVAEGNTSFKSSGGVLFTSDMKTLVQCPGAMNTYTIPDSVTSIGNSAFWRCTSLTSVTIPNAVTSIGDYIFSGCSGLTSVTIPASVTSIGFAAFGDCTSLTSVTFNSATTVIYDSGITIPTGASIIGHSPSTARDYAAKYRRAFYSIEGGIPGADVTFEDANLAAAVHSSLGIASGTPISDSDMLLLTTLNAESKGITNLSGLERATNLRTVHLYDNAISDLSPLSALPKIYTLEVAGNQISDLRPLSGLSSLRYLSLGGTYWANTPQEKIRGNAVSDISPLASLTGLTTLHLSNCNVSDLTPLRSLVNLGVLALGSNQITDIAPLSSLTKLTYLTLTKSRVADLSPISGLLLLNHLTLSENRLTDIGPLVANSGIGAGDRVVVSRNFLVLGAGTQSESDIDVLVARGATVLSTPQNITEIPTGTDVTITANRVTVHFPLVSTPGTLTVTPYFGPRHPVPGTTHLLPDLYFDISPTATFTGTAIVTIEVPWNVYNGDLATLKVFHWKDGAWVEPTGLTVDNTSRTLTFSTDSFSDYAVGTSEETPGEPPVTSTPASSDWSLALLGVVGVGFAGLAMRRRRLS